MVDDDKEASPPKSYTATSRSLRFVAYYCGIETAGSDLPLCFGLACYGRLIGRSANVEKKQNWTSHKWKVFVLRDDLTLLRVLTDPSQSKTVTVEKKLGWHASAG